jgi:hypothetical protein
MHSFWTQVFFREMISRRSVVEGDLPRVKNDGIYNGKPLDDGDDDDADPDEDGEGSEYSDMDYDNAKADLAESGDDDESDTDDGYGYEPSEVE